MKYQSGILYLEQIFNKNEGEIKLFSDKPKESIGYQHTHTKNIVMEILQAERKLSHTGNSR